MSICKFIKSNLSCLVIVLLPTPGLSPNKFNALAELTTLDNVIICCLCLSAVIAPDAKDSLSSSFDFSKYSLAIFAFKAYLLLEEYFNAILDAASLRAIVLCVLISPAKGIAKPDIAPPIPDCNA